MVSWPWSWNSSRVKTSPNGSRTDRFRSTTTRPPQRSPGDGNWIAADISEAKLFRAMTIDNARVMRLDAEIGTIEPGKKANLLLLGADPLKNVKAYDAIETVFLHGRPLSRTAVFADRPGPATVSTFLRHDPN
jgi:hypothetical protein